MEAGTVSPRVDYVAVIMPLEDAEALVQILTGGDDCECNRVSMPYCTWCRKRKDLIERIQTAAPWLEEE